MKVEKSTKVFLLTTNIKCILPVFGSIGNIFAQSTQSYYYRRHLKLSNSDNLINLSGLFSIKKSKIQVIFSNKFISARCKRILLYF